MAKSTGNFERVTELRDQGIDPLAFRYLALTVRYGRKLNYSADSIAAAGAALASLRGHLAALGPPPADGPWAPPVPLRAGSSGPRPVGIAGGVVGHQAAQADPAGATAADPPLVDRAAETGPLSPAGRALHERFVAAIDDDLDLPTALAVIRETLRADLPADERRWLVLDADLVLGLDLDLAWASVDDELPAGAAALLAARTAAREARDWARADALRDELAAMGVELTDGPGGTTARRRDP
jgi:cysteinyl-tRNA synthetase